MPVTIAETDSDILACFTVMAQLRPHLKEADFVSLVRRQYAEGYRLVFVRPEQKVAAVAGYRILHNLVWGRFCYVDDLVTDEQVRSQGLGAELLHWLGEHAHSERCTRLELDSGVQRHAAHRFYLAHRMFISCHHFSLEL